MRTELPARHSVLSPQSSVLEPPLGGECDVLRLQAFRALNEVELHAGAFRKAAEPLRLDRAEVDEHVLSARHGDEAEALRVVEPLDSAGPTHVRTFSYLVYWWCYRTN